MCAAMIRYRSVVADSARWEGFPFRNGDIVISTPSKCGTTWTQMICALLVFQTPDFALPLAEISPWLDMLTTDRDDLVAALEAQPHRRFIKTHTPLDGLPFDDRATYICVGRDPRDAGFSWSNHLANLDMDALFTARRKAVGLADLDELLPEGPRTAPPETEIERFWHWVDNPAPVSESSASLAALVHHIRTFWPATAGAPNLVLLHYDDLQADLEGQMRHLARRLRIDVPEQRWPQLVPAARFGEMRSRADHLVPNRGDDLWRDNAEFFHRGTSGQWRALLRSDDLRRYHRRVAELGDPEVAGWLHRDPAAG
ncbi:MAG: sulfotransferase [Pseudonocardiales bacterium]|nr:MAG: sulfotransferase [Pseudonocardiales bacterium]